MDGRVLTEILDGSSDHGRRTMEYEASDERERIGRRLRELREPRGTDS
jgi:hypothetical protein